MRKGQKSASKLHKNVPPDRYWRSIKENVFQKYWHGCRFEEVGKLVESSGGTILDIGSADGVFTNEILKKSNAKQIIGIDVLKSSVDWANKHWKDPRLKFIVADAHNLPFRAGSFDAVFALEVLEHVFEPMEVFREVKRVLKKEGYGVFLVPSDNFLFKNIVWPVWTKFRGKIWVDTHIQTYNNDFLRKMVEQIGFKVEQNKKFILGMLNVVKVRKV